jgi:hypothetical protein
VDTGQLSFRVHHITGLELPGLDTLPDHALDSLVGRSPISTVFRHRKIAPLSRANNQGRYSALSLPVKRCEHPAQANPQVVEAPQPSRATAAYGHCLHSFAQFGQSLSRLHGQQAIPSKLTGAESPTLQMRSIEKIISLRLFFS